MTQPAPNDIKATYPPNNALRVGTATVAADGSVTVSVQGGDVQCGFLDPAGLASDAPVALLRGEASWLALGAVRDRPPSTTVVSASGDLILTTTAQNIPGAAVTVTVSVPTPYYVLACFDLNITVAAATVGVGTLTIDGVEQTPAGNPMSSATAVVRLSGTQQWAGTLAPGTHTFQLQGRKTVNLGTLTHVRDNTTISVRLGA